MIAIYKEQADTVIDGTDPLKNQVFNVINHMGLTMHKIFEKRVMPF